MRNETKAAAVLLGIDPDKLNRALATIESQGNIIDRLVTVKRAAELLTVSQRTLCDWLRDGKLIKVQLSPPHHRQDGRMAGGRIGVRLSDIQAIVQNGMATHLRGRRS